MMFWRETAPTRLPPRTTGKTSCRECTARCSASSSVSEAESVLNWVSMTSRMSTLSASLCDQQAWVFHVRCDEHERAHDDEP